MPYSSRVPMMRPPTLLPLEPTDTTARRPCAERSGNGPAGRAGRRPPPDATRLPGPPMCCPAPSRGRILLFDGACLRRFSSSRPDDVDPGAGQDTPAVVVVSAGAGALVEIGGQGLAWPYLAHRPHSTIARQNGGGCQHRVPVDGLRNMGKWPVAEARRSIGCWRSWSARSTACRSHKAGVRLSRSRWVVRWSAERSFRTGNGSTRSSTRPGRGSQCIRVAPSTTSTAVGRDCSEASASPWSGTARSTAPCRTW